MTRKQTQKSKQSKLRPVVKRQTRHFQLRIGEAYPVDAHVAEILDYKRTKRSEVTAIRDGVRLLWALENNDLSVLFEMFPHLKPQVAGGGGGVDDLQQIKSMLEIVVAGRKSGELVMQSEQSAAPKQIEAPKFAMPIFEDDDEPTVLIRASTSTDSSMNFVTALRNMA